MIVLPRVFILFAFAAALILGHPTQAQTTVNVGCDPVALITAIIAANNTPEPDTLSLASGCDYIFSNGFDPLDIDFDGLNDDWEFYWFGDLNQIATGDPDGEGCDNECEEAHGTYPVARPGDPTDPTDTDGDYLDDYEEVFVYDTDGTDPDTDDDGLSDYDEVRVFSTDPLSTDSDADTLTDYAEIMTHQTNPNSPDSDMDRLDDADEVAGLYNTSAIKFDTDGDMLWDGDEVEVYTTRPDRSDTDGDGLSDYEEILRATNPNETDTDNDNLSDGDEVNLYMSDPLDEDTDGDTVTDGDEIACGTSPLMVSTFPPYSDADYCAGGSVDPDTDDDNLPDIWEVNTFGHLGYGPLDDPDGDVINNQDERLYGTHANNYDTDGDGRSDGEEVFGIGGPTSNPKSYDTDGDGLADGEEVHEHGTNPNLGDTDSDTLSDLYEVNTVHTGGHKTSPTHFDTDGDILSDGAELNTYNTKPWAVDSDADRLTDYHEVIWLVTDPNDIDTDNDNLFDGDEVQIYTTDPVKPDTDDDTVWDGDEIACGTSPLLPETTPGIPDATVCNGGRSNALSSAVRADPAGTALPLITTPIVIHGNGATLARAVGSPEFRLLEVGSSGSLTIDKIVITGGRADYGGGIYNSGTLTLIETTIMGNSSGRGGGIISNGTLLVVDSVISGNTSGWGGGIMSVGLVTVLNSTISSNEAVNGGAIGLLDSTLTMVNSTLSGNSANKGGGIWSEIDGDTLIISNSLISGNSATTGGAIYSNNDQTVIQITSSTIFGNASPYNGAGGILNFEGTLEVKNSIVWGNDGGQIMTSYAPALVTNSLVQGGYPGTGNLDSDPLFVSPIPNSNAPATGGDYRLQVNSPAINVGSNADLSADVHDLDSDANTTEPLPYDVAGQPRIINNVVDIGAYEHQVLADVVLSTEAASVSEGGSGASYTVRLAAIPTADVTVSILSGSQITAAPNTLVFNRSNWSVEQVVTVTAVDDDVVEGGHSDLIAHNVTSEDMTYDGFAASDVTVTISDNDIASIELLTNGGFEDGLSPDKAPVGWTIKNAFGDKLKCEPLKAHSGNCAFKFRGAAAENTVLTQVVDLTDVTLHEGDHLALNAFVKGGNKAVRAKFILAIVYMGDALPTRKLTTVGPSTAYKQVSLPTAILSSGEVQKITVMVKHKSLTGALWLDTVSLTLTPATGDAASIRGVPAPSNAPESFRGSN
jgi:hypothetical protein